MTILSLLPSSIFSAVLVCHLVFLLCFPGLTHLSFLHQKLPRRWLSSERLLLGGLHVSTARLPGGAAWFSLVVFSLTVPDDSISLILYWSFSLSQINANLFGSTSVVKSEFACGVLSSSSDINS